MTWTALSSNFHNTTTRNWLPSNWSSNQSNKALNSWTSLKAGFGRSSKNLTICRTCKSIYLTISPTVTYTTFLAKLLPLSQISLTFAACVHAAWVLNSSDMYKMTGESESEEIQGKKDKVSSLSVDPLPCPFLLSLSPILLRLLAIYTGDARTRKGKEREGIAQSSHFLLLQLQTCSRPEKVSLTGRFL